VKYEVVSPLVRVRKNAGLILPLLMAMLLAPGLSTAQELKPEEIYQKVLPSVMTLHVENGLGENYVGTAFLALDKNIAVTAWHVVSDARVVTAKFSNGRIVNVDGVIDHDVQHDLALVHLRADNLPEVSFCFKNPPVGARAYVIGAPKGFDFSITDGLISQIQNIRGSEEFQVSCPISGGDSGGPIVNEMGQVVGIAAWTQKDAQNLSFAIPASFVARLNAKRTPTRWSEITNHEEKPAATAAASPVKTTADDAAELRHVLKSAAGKRVAITVSDGDREQKFDLVLPGDFVR
jgi:serine protease Do